MCVSAAWAYIFFIQNKKKLACLTMKRIPCRDYSQGYKHAKTIYRESIDIFSKFQMYIFGFDSAKHC